MLKSTGCKIALLVVAAVLIGGLGFVSGFATRSVIAAMQPEPPVVEVPVTVTPAAQVEVPVVPTAAGVPTTEPPQVGSSMDQKTFDVTWEAWDLVRQEFYGDIPNNEELTNGAIRGMIGTLDDEFTAFIDPKAAAILHEDQTGSFEGIGATVTMREGALTIVSTFEGQPAEKAGLRADDIILQVDDTKIENMSIYEAISLIRGPEGTAVRLKILRDAEEPFDVELTRARIEVPLVKSEMRQDGIAYVALFQFDPNATDKLAAAIEPMLAQNPKGLILDLRGNPGGLLSEAVLTPGLFLPRGTLVLHERFKDGSETPYNTPNNPIAPDIKLVVLVDGGSASASEIVAGALQDYGRAVLIGEKTFGKGSVQLVHQLSNGAELRVTAARWFTPKNRGIHGQGIEPDITVELTAEDADAGRDPQLDRAVQYLLTGK